MTQHNAEITSAATSNLRIVMAQFGGPEVLQTSHEPMPVPGPGEVRVRVLAASAQFTDTMIRSGNYPPLRSKPPFSPGYDFIGVVDAIGEGVTKVSVGQRVADLTVVGSYARFVIRSAATLVPVPDTVDPAEAAALVLSWVTAYQLLHRDAKVQPGSLILVHGAAGAVGSALVKLAQLHGVRVIGTARAEHHEQLRQGGATPVDYREEDWEARVMELSDGAGVDVVFDGIGEDGFRKSWRVLARGGRLHAYGFLKPAKGEAGTSSIVFALLRQLLWNAWPNGKKAGFYSITKWREKHPEQFDEDLAILFGLLDEGAIQPRVEARLPLVAAADAHRRIEAGGLSGKLILVPQA